MRAPHGSRCLIEAALEVEAAIRGSENQRPMHHDELIDFVTKRAEAWVKAMPGDCNSAYSNYWETLENYANEVALTLNEVDPSYVPATFYDNLAKEFAADLEDA